MSTTQTNTHAVGEPPRTSILVRMAGRFGIEPTKMLATLKATAFQGDVSNEQLSALLIVAEAYNLNPWTRELYAFPDKNNGIVPVVSVDGWARIVNEHPHYDGCKFEFTPTSEGGEMTCTMYRKDRLHPTILTEYMSECKRNSGAWQVTPRRMLRHRAFIQAARLAFGFAGIYDEGEARDIINMGAVQYADDPTPEIDPETGEIKPRTSTQKVKEALRAKRKGKDANPAEETPPEAGEAPSKPSLSGPDWPDPNDGDARGLPEEER